MARTILVDGYNVIRRDPALLRFEQQSLERARDVLLACLNGSPAFRRDEIICVFDGAHSLEAGVRGSRRFRRGRVEVVFSAPGESADTVLGRLAAQLPSGTVVVTNDNEVRAAVRAAGATPINLAPRATAARPRPGHVPPNRPRPNDTWVKADDLDDAPSGPKKGNPRRAPRGRRRGRDEDVRW